MNIIELRNRQDISVDKKLSNIYFQFGELLREIEKKELTLNIIESIKQDVQEINSSSFKGNELRKLVKQKQTKILKHLEKGLKIVPKNHYRNIWLPVGMTAFGIPIGVAFGIVTNNMALLAIGFPFGMFFGTAIGSSLDKKAAYEGRQLDIEIKY